MKKGLIFATTLAMALGVGVAVGAHRSDAKVANAYGKGDTTWYLCHEGNSWSKNSAADHFTYSKDVGNNWEFETDNYIQLSKDEKFNIVYSWNDGEGWNTFTPNLMTSQSEETVFTVPPEADYAVAARDIKVKFFFQVYGEGASWTGLYWEEYEEPAADPDYYLEVYGTYYKMALDEEDKPEGVLHQYSATPEYPYRARELSFYSEVDDVKTKITENIGVDYTGESPTPGNNIVGDVESGFRFYHYNTTKVYLKTYADGGKSVWGTGYAENSYSVTVKDGLGSATRYYLSLDEDFEPNPTYKKQYKTSEAISIKALAGTEWASSNGLDCGGVSEDLTVEAIAGNNAMQAFQSTAWKVHNDCTEVIYLKEKADLTLVMYIGGYEEAHVLTIGGQNVALSKGEGNQYVAHGVALSAGDAVTAYTIEGEAVAVTSKKVANNNLKEDKTILANVASADIYYDTEAKNLWISGLPAAGQHLLKNGTTAIEMTHVDPFDDFDQYASAKLSFKANDTIKVLNTGADNDYAVVWCPDIVATSTALAGKFVYDSEKDEMKCVADCSAAVYLKIKSGLDEVYFGDVDPAVDKAVEFANGFKSAMAGACSSEGKKDAVEAAWAAQAAAYAALAEEAQNELKKGLSSAAEEVRDFAERYVSIKQQHSTWTLANFLSWDIPASSRYAGLDEFNATDSNAMIIVIAIAAVSALAFTTLLVLKKRKQR